jgi:hypothetical protein
VKHYINVLNGYDKPRYSMVGDVFMRCVSRYGTTAEINQFLMSRTTLNNIHILPSQDLLRVSMEQLGSDTLKASKIAQCYRRGVMPPDVVSFINDNPLFATNYICTINPDVMDAFGDYS